MTQTEINYLIAICEKGMEKESINFLSNSLDKKCKEIFHRNAEYRAIIRAVKAVNKGKNEAISDLCDID